MILYTQAGLTGFNEYLARCLADEKRIKRAIQYGIMNDDQRDQFLYDVVLKLFLRQRIVNVREFRILARTLD